MSFFNTYKKLDNLIKESFQSETGISFYIEQMEMLREYSNYIPGWDDDYYTLKRYRHIRNLIAHEDNADEGSLCTMQDEEWLEYFCTRIMAEDDPLTRYNRGSKGKKQSFTFAKETKRSNPRPIRYDEVDSSVKMKPRKMSAEQLEKKSRKQSDRVYKRRNKSTYMLKVIEKVCTVIAWLDVIAILSMLFVK